MAEPTGLPLTSPVPELARGPAIPESGYLLEEIEDRLFWLTDGLYQMIFLVSDEGVIAVDAPPTLGHNIGRAIRAVTKMEVTHAVYSHHHADHAGAMALYQGADFYAHEAAAVLLRRDHDPNRPLPGRTFTDSMELDVGGVSLELTYHGPNHCPGNAFIYARAQRVLMLVDVVFPGWVPFAYLAVSQDIPGSIAAPSIALEYPFTTFVGGHLTRLGTRKDLTEHQAYIEELRTECAAALDSFDVGTVFEAVDPTNPWAIFRGYLDGVASQAAAGMHPRWRDRLGGVEAFTDKNAFAMTESLRIDYGHLGPFGIRE